MATIRKRTGRSLRSKNGLIRHAFDKTSQNGEDGIIQRLFELLPSPTIIDNRRTPTRWCVDVGAWDGKHLSNTYTLLVENGWKGVLIEADAERFQDLKQRHPDQCCLNCVVSCLSSSPYALLELLRSTSLPSEFDFLCIDVDGSDYWLLKQILESKEYTPKVICVEFNPTMPNDLIYIPPHSDVERHGASLAALVELCEAEGYVLVETTIYNAFFVPVPIYQEYLINIVPDNSIEALHEVTMGTELYQLYDGTLKLHGCKKLLWHRKPIDEKKLQMLDMPQRSFPFAPVTTSDKQYRDIAVDLSKYHIHDPEGSKQVTDALWQQLQDTGFCLIRGTGMSPATCRKAMSSCNAFLHLANEKVRRSTLTKDRARRGYSPMCTENFASLIGDKGVPNDVVRKFRVGPLEGSGESSLLQPNVWPQEWDDSETFRTTIATYYQQACHVAETVVKAICDAVITRSEPTVASALDVFLEDTSSNTSILTLLGYRVGSRHKRQQPLVAAHTDVGVVTMLLFDAGDCAKLQRKSNIEGEKWVDVCLPGKICEDPVFVVNIGDCLSDLAAGLLPSTLHRVVPNSGQNPRNCLALFVGLEPQQELRMPVSGESMTYESWRKQRIARAHSALS